MISQPARKVALITGAGSGIGAATAELLAQRGFQVGVLTHTAAEARKVVERIERAGGEAVALVADVRDEKGMQVAVKQLVERFGGLDALFANAGINGAAGPLDTLTVEDFDETVGTNFKGTFITLKAAVPELKKRAGAAGKARSGGGPAVVICSSINGTHTFNDPGTIIYSATKAALIAMAKLLALELAKDTIRVTAICPGSIDTQIDENTEKRSIDRAGHDVRFPKGEIPLTGKQPGRAEQVARLVAFLMSDEADHITGTEVVIDGGQSLVV
jgi:NAD(P)-dependent dehydrogenase (short-subunit alcohol dehydrogenase family)